MAKDPILSFLVSLGTVIMVHWCLARSKCSVVRFVDLANGMMKDLSVAGFGISDFTWKVLTVFVMQARGKADEQAVISLFGRSTRKCLCRLGVLPRFA